MNSTQHTAGTNVTEMDCLIFTGQAEKLAEKAKGHISFLSAHRAEVVDANGKEHSLIGPASGNEHWMRDNRRYARSL